jgi:hypothetical protein
MISERVGPGYILDVTSMGDKGKEFGQLNGRSYGKV